MSRKTAAVTLEIEFHPAFEISPGAWDWKALFRQWGGDELADRLVQAVPTAVPEKPADDDAWIHERLGAPFTRFQDYTWAEMARGPVGGGRHKYLTWIRNNTVAAGLGFHEIERVRWALAQIES
jgi:hypothetical protein